MQIPFPTIHHSKIFSNWSHTSQKSVEACNPRHQYDSLHKFRESDHELWILRIRIKLACKGQPPKVTAPKYRTPTEEQLSEYNHKIRQLQNQASPRNSHSPLTGFAQRVQSAAAHSLSRIPPKQRQEYISANTWNLLQSGQNTLVQGDCERANNFSSIIKQEVRKDKKEHLSKELEELEGNAYSWTGLKRLWSRPRLKFTKFKDKDVDGSQGVSTHTKLQNT